MVQHKQRSAARSRKHAHPADRLFAAHAASITRALPNRDRAERAINAPQPLSDFLQTWRGGFGETPAWR